MTASFLPPILTPVVTLVFPGICFAYFLFLLNKKKWVNVTLNGFFYATKFELQKETLFEIKI